MPKVYSGVKTAITEFGVIGLVADELTVVETSR